MRRAPAIALSALLLAATPACREPAPVLARVQVSPPASPSPSLYEPSPAGGGPPRIAGFAPGVDESPSQGFLRPRGVIQKARTVTLSYDVNPDREALTFETNYLGRDVLMTLESPSGRVYNRSTGHRASREKLAPPPGAHYLVDKNLLHGFGLGSDLFLIRNPEPGVWRVRLAGPGVVDSSGEVTLGQYPQEPATVSVYAYARARR